MIGVVQRRYGPVGHTVPHAFNSECQRHVVPESDADVVSPGFVCRPQKSHQFECVMRFLSAAMGVRQQGGWRHALSARRFRPF